MRSDNRDAAREAAAHSLDLSGAEFRRVVAHAAERLAEHLDGLPTAAVSDNRGGDALTDRLFDEEPPEVGRPLNDLVDQVVREVIPTSYNTASPGYLAYVPGGGLPTAAVAELISHVTNRYSTVWLAAPGPSTLEANVVRWICRFVGYPHEAFGLLTSGGSMANLIGIVTAREERRADPQNATVYMSDQVHHCVSKSLRFAAFPATAMRVIGSDERQRLRVDELRQAITADVAAGREPMMVIASAGTTNTGAIDDLDEIADVAREHSLWFHVDAAYGGFFAMTERGRARLAGMERADSIVLDPHKSMFMPYGTGCILVRDGAALRRAHGGSADYMPQMQDDARRVDFCELGPELSREWRGLRLWLPLCHHGVGAFRDALDLKMDLAEDAQSRIASRDDVRIVTPNSLSLFAFRVEPDDIDREQLNEFNHRVMHHVNRRQHVFLTGTQLGEVFVIRVCVLHLRTDRSRIDALLEDLDLAVADARRDLDDRLA